MARLRAPVALLLGAPLVLAQGAGAQAPSCSAAPVHGFCYRSEMKQLKAKSVVDCCAACAAQKNCSTYQFETGKLGYDKSHGGVCKLFDPTARPNRGDCLTGSSAWPPALPALVQNRFGPFADEKDEELSVEYPFISGFTSSSCSWGKVEPQNGVFNWTLCRHDMEFAHAHGKDLLISPQTGSYAPVDWLPAAGVPAVVVCSHKWTKDPSKCPKDLLDTFPYYMAPAYHGLWRRYHQALHDMIKALPKELADRVRTIQVMQGATGDLTPWHGRPVDAEYVINDDSWKRLWVNGTATMIEVWTDLLPTTKLLFNA
eukprot:gene16432-8246_t